MPSSSSGLLDYLADIPDPRIERCQAHRLIDILMIAVCGAICGADNWVAIAEFGRAKADWLKTFLALPNGIPSHDTFGRVFARLSTCWPSRPINPNSTPISNSFLTAATQHSTPIPPSIIGPRKTKITGVAKRGTTGPPTRLRTSRTMPCGRAYACSVWSKPPGTAVIGFRSSDATISPPWTTTPNGWGRPCVVIGPSKIH